MYRFPWASHAWQPRRRLMSAWEAMPLASGWVAPQLGGGLPDSRTCNSVVWAGRCMTNYAVRMRLAPSGSEIRPLLDKQDAGR